VYFGIKTIVVWRNPLVQQEEEEEEEEEDTWVVVVQSCFC
jgi:hypothetical protein